MDTQVKATNSVWFKVLLVVVGAVLGAAGLAAYQKVRTEKPATPPAQ